ncbi:MAG: hypothetical protein LPK00_06515 [Bacillaceae bacterium]|nr:hypothetical protein [Bacillaceae bacterium]
MFEEGRKINKSHITMIISITITLFLLASCGIADGGRVTARDVLKQNKDADIIQYAGSIYSNVTNLEWFQERKEQIVIKKDYYVGEVQNQTNNSWKFKELSATKLPKGTKVYSRDEEVGGMLIVEYEGEILYYMELLEG